jgi:cation:H+ antiporter
VSVVAALRGQGDLAVGNLAGANILNVGLILGLCAVIRPLRVSLPLLRYDAPVLVAVTLAGALLLADGRVGRVEGAFLCAGFFAYTIANIVIALRTARVEPGADAPVLTRDGPRALVVQIAGMLAGLALLVLGAHWLVEAASSVAKVLGASELLVGITIVAIGTSLPELAISAVAARRGEADLAIGNVLGSNAFRILGILGLCALLHPIEAPSVSLADLVLMAGFAAVLLVLLRRGAVLSRAEGMFLLAGYGAYLAWQLLRT